MKTLLGPRYGFGGRLNELFPSQVVVDLTDCCNLRCVHCVHGRNGSLSGKKHGFLAFDLNKKMVDEVSVCGASLTQYIRYTGNGEPLLHPDLCRILRYASLHSGTAVALTTNGTLLTKERAQEILATGVQLVDISVDAYREETYAKIRVGGSLDVTVRNVLSLIAEARKARQKPRIVLSFIERTENKSEKSQFSRFWLGKGVDYIIWRREHSNAGFMEDPKQGVRKRLPIRRPCLYPWERITLNARGELAFCPQDWVNGSRICKFESTTIRDVWQGETYRRLREAHLTNDFSRHSFCGHCPDWACTRWPRQGRSYADMVSDLIHPVRRLPETNSRQCLKAPRKRS